jgi:hypothetical protein
MHETVIIHLYDMQVVISKLQHFREFSCRTVHKVSIFGGSFRIGSAGSVSSLDVATFEGIFLHDVFSARFQGLLVTWADRWKSGVKCVHTATKLEEIF